MHDLAPIIKDLAVVLGMASIVTLIFQYIRQPVVLGYLVAGIIVGPHLITQSMITDLHDVKVIAELGVIFLMFSLGLEFSFHKLVSVGFSASITGFMEVGLMMLIGFVTGILLNWSFYDSLFLGAALSISSTTIIIKALEELHLKGKRFAELIFGVLIVEDLLAILLLVALSSIVTSKDPLYYALSLDAIKLFVIVGSWFIVGYFLVPLFFRHIVVYASLYDVMKSVFYDAYVIAALDNYDDSRGIFLKSFIQNNFLLVALLPVACLSLLVSAGNPASRAQRYFIFIVTLCVIFAVWN